MKRIFFSLLFLGFLDASQAQLVKTVSLKKVITLLMPRTAEDEMPGTRGASVVWHPMQKKYYAAMAGNIDYPLGVYNIAGKRLSSDNLNCNADVRGLWYNPLKKQIQGNSYNDYGWFGIKLDARGIPLSTDIFKEGMNQPNDQSVGAFKVIGQQVLFLNNGIISFYSIDGTLSDLELKINWGRTKADGVSEEVDEETITPEDYNTSTVVYTGIKGAELGFLNITEMQVELYNIADGFLTKKLKLPENAPMYPTFNFAYTNGMYWLFNIETRVWTAYK